MISSYKIALIRKLQGNVLIDDLGCSRLTDFGFAIVTEHPELQWTIPTAGRTLASRWRAPEVLGIDGDPQQPNFKSDIYSFGSVAFFVRIFVLM